MNLRKLAKDQSCIRCGSTEGVVLCHYTGPRRLFLGGGYGIKAQDIAGAHMCGSCHRYMDTLCRDKSKKWEHSEEFLYLVVLTVIRLLEQERLVVK